MVGGAEGLEERLLISTGVEETGSCDSNLLAFVISCATAAGSAVGAVEALVLAIVGVVERSVSMSRVFVSSRN